MFFQLRSNGNVPAICKPAFLTDKRVTLTQLILPFSLMKFEAVTIKDIARELGISTSTVSRALRDSYEISLETKNLVLECAERLHYTPNPIALSLKEKRSRSIAV